MSHRVSIERRASHFNTSPSVRLQPTVDESFIVGPVRENFALRDGKLNSIHEYFSSWKNDQAKQSVDEHQ